MKNEHDWRVPRELKQALTNVHKTQDRNWRLRKGWAPNGRSYMNCWFDASKRSDQVDMRVSRKLRGGG